MERMSQEIIGSNEDVVAIEKEFDALEAKMGNVPSKRRYWSVYSGLPSFTMIWEREWESMAALEAYYNQTMIDPEWASLSKKAGKIFANGHLELYAGW